MENRQYVVVTDVQMKFWSIVILMVKWALASVPALLILMVLGSLAFGGLATFFVSANPFETGLPDLVAPTAVDEPTGSSVVDDFEVVEARFLMKDGALGPEPIIELTVRNGTPFAVSRAHFSGRLSSPGRSIPWLEEGFNYDIPGGLEPGESAEWRLAPNRFGEWGSVDAPADAVLEVTVTRLDGPGGERIG